MKFNNSLKILFSVFILGLCAVGCSPKVVLVDRHTVLEEQAAGEWPDFESRMREHLQKKGPTAFRKTEVTRERERLYQVLNGELVSDSKQ